VVIYNSAGVCAGSYTAIQNIPYSALDDGLDERGNDPKVLRLELRYKLAFLRQAAQ
jgi:hypothetical protein